MANSVKSESGNKKTSLVYPVNLKDEDDVVSWIAEIISEDESIIRSCLLREFEQPGSNVAEAFFRAALEPFVWSEKLGQFYEQTNAFLYELVLWNRNSIKRRMRSYIAKYLTALNEDGLNVLCVGDGLGFDSFYFAQAGHKVTYFEVPGYTHSFASRLFNLAAADIKIASGHEQIASEFFDAVVCLDVLEHIPDVPGFLDLLTGYLRPGGVFIVHAPYYMIHSTNPTHLKINRKYSGSLKLYSQCGLRLTGGKFFWNPLIFEKVSDSTTLRSPSALHIFVLRLSGLYFALGRLTNLPFRWINFYRRRHYRWFE